MNRHSVGFLPLVTRRVNPTVETATRVNYKSRGLKPRVSGHLIVALIATPLLMGGACEKKSTKPADPGVAAALDHTGSDSPDGPVDLTPLAGIDVGKLSTEKQQVFYKLIGTLSSPCGKAHSLRTSFTSDTSCKRAPFAVRYVLNLLEDEATEAQVTEEFEKKYKATPDKVKLDVTQAPHTGSEDAPIRLVEFYDYGCPHCQAFKPMMEQVMTDEQGKVVEYFMMF